MSINPTPLKFRHINVRLSLEKKRVKCSLSQEKCESEFEC